ncbi:MAG: DUF1634 domain-containing protein [Bdellovibrionales bacterium]|nr:DUF1634 domain-containing protein [Bdellovibrionales bacterium]
MKDLENMELKISKFLRAGVILSGVIIAIGWGMSFKSDSDPFVPLQTYSSLNIVDSLQMNFILQNWGKIIAYFGLALLISLPVIRVFLSVILFIKQKEKTMALIGAIVLIGLILSFSLGVEA